LEATKDDAQQIIRGSIGVVCQGWHSIKAGTEVTDIRVVWPRWYQCLVAYRNPTFGRPAIPCRLVAEF